VSHGPFGVQNAWHPTPRLERFLPRRRGLRMERARRLRRHRRQHHGLPGVSHKERRVLRRGTIPNRATQVATAGLDRVPTNGPRPEAPGHPREAPGHPLQEEVEHRVEEARVQGEAAPADAQVEGNETSRVVVDASRRSCLGKYA